MKLSDIPWASHARACVDGEWLIVLDLRGDRYWALPRPRSLEAATSALNARGLLAPHGGKARGARRAWPVWLAMLDGAFWADSILRTGRLDRAFSWIGKQALCAAVLDPGSMERLFADFERTRVWIPRAYVCLFNSLCLIRFLFRQGARASLVFGVRARPFSAHCWVEANGVILDPGGEDCATFTEIARV